MSFFSHSRRIHLNRRHLFSTANLKNIKLTPSTLKTPSKLTHSKVILLSSPFLLFCSVSFPQQCELRAFSRAVKAVRDARRPEKMVFSRWPEQQHCLFWESWTGATFVQELSSESFCIASAWMSTQHQQNTTYLLFRINHIQSKCLGHQRKERKFRAHCFPGQCAPNELGVKVTWFGCCSRGICSCRVCLSCEHIPEPAMNLVEIYDSVWESGDIELFSVSFWYFKV